MKPLPVTIWQPPNVELPPRSKASTIRLRPPPQILTAGTRTRQNSKDEKPSGNGLFQPKPKKSLDEMMWLGSVAGFAPKSPTAAPNSLRSKLVRKPEQIPSQASAVTGPKALQAIQKREEEIRAREKRLQEWSTKKKPDVSEKTNNGNPSSTAASLLPQPIESRLRPRQKVYNPLPQAEEAARISNRPRAIHRPHIPPDYGDGSYAPERSFLPHPIETVRRSNRPNWKPKGASVDEESVWMGLPQPIETTSRSTRGDPAVKIVQGETTTSPKAVGEKRRTPSPTYGQPIRVTHKSTSPERKNVHLLPQLIETTRKSNRPRRNEILPEPIESTRRSHRSPLVKEEKLPVPIESTRRTNRPPPAPRQQKSPVTPPTSFFGPDILPQPVETTRRSHRPISARPLIPLTIESSVRPTRMRIPVYERHLELPQPVSVLRHTNRSPGPRLARRESSARPVSTGGKDGGDQRKGKEKRDQNQPGPADDHVCHLHEPIDSAPPSPIESPRLTPSSSKCPSLSSSPTPSATSAFWAGLFKFHGWGAEVTENKKSIHSVETDLKKLKTEDTKAVVRQRTAEGSEYPLHLAKDDVCIRGETTETIRPTPLVIKTAPTLDAGDKHGSSDYRICCSPTFENFKRPRPPTPNEDHIDFYSTLVTAPEISEKEAIFNANGELPTPPNSNTSCVPSKKAKLAARLEPIVVGAPMWRGSPAGPSPGYTVASLPPTKQKACTTKEITPDFVDDVYRYLSLQFENIASQFDPELSLYTGIPIEEVKSDRKAALTVYCEKWVFENPDFASGETSKGGMW